jgi:integrase
MEEPSMVAGIKLSDRFAAQAEGPPADSKTPWILYRDAADKGFGLRVTQAGAKSWTKDYSTAGGTERRYTIGSYPAWREKPARKEAQRLQVLVDQGHDPMAQRRERRAAPAVADLIEAWRKEHSHHNSESYRAESESAIRDWIMPDLGRRKLSDVSSRDIAALHRKITERGFSHRANRILSLLSKMFSLAVEWGWCANHPCKGVKRNREDPRERFLGKTELPRLVAAIEAHPRRQPARALRLMQLTGCRKGEALDARFEDFDLETGRWVKPAAGVKQRKIHVAPLNEEALELLREMDEEREKAGRPRSAQLFPGINDVKRDWAKICAAADIKDLRIHDLRHSYASLLVAEGVSLPIVGALLGHRNVSTTQRYGHLADDPLRAATQKVGDIVTEAGRAPKAEVVPLRKGVR